MMSWGTGTVVSCILHTACSQPPLNSYTHLCLIQLFKKGVRLSSIRLGIQRILQRLSTFGIGDTTVIRRILVLWYLTVLLLTEA
jgi:hypothetical protein